MSSSLPFAVADKTSEDPRVEPSSPPNPTISSTGYLAGGDLVFKYPLAGDDRPPTGAKVLLLTVGAVCVTGHWSDTGGFLGWAPLPKRDKNKEASISKIVRI